MRVNTSIIFILFLFSSFAYSEEFIRFTNKEEKINIVEYENIHVNQKCANDKEKCLMFFIKKVKNHKSKKAKDIQVGNPASTICTETSGRSEIYKDKNNNEHDYCEFKEGYIIDSWDLLKRFKK